MRRFKVESENEIKIWEAAHDAILITGAIMMIFGFLSGFIIGRI